MATAKKAAKKAPAKKAAPRRRPLRRRHRRRRPLRPRRPPGEEGCGEEGRSGQEGRTGQEGCCEEGPGQEAHAERRVHEGADAQRRNSPPWSASAPLPRTEVVSKLWAYIKKNKLQDAVNKRMVNADAKLKEIFGKAQVSMFEMAGLIGKHVK